MDELMLTHHELASSRFLASLHELNCNQCAVRHNSCRKQFTEARLSIHAGRKVAIHRVFSVKDNTHISAFVLFSSEKDITEELSRSLVTYRLLEGVGGRATL